MPKGGNARGRATPCAANVSATERRASSLLPTPGAQRGLPDCGRRRCGDSGSAQLPDAGRDALRPAVHRAERVGEGQWREGKEGRGGLRTAEDEPASESKSESAAYVRAACARCGRFRRRRGDPLPGAPYLGGLPREVSRHARAVRPQMHYGGFLSGHSQGRPSPTPRVSEISGPLMRARARYVLRAQSPATAATWACVH